MIEQRSQRSGLNRRPLGVMRQSSNGIMPPHLTITPQYAAVKPLDPAKSPAESGPVLCLARRSLGVVVGLVSLVWIIAARIIANRRGGK